MTVATTRQAVLLALYLLEQTKTYAERCGGDSHVLVLKPGPQHAWIDSAVVTGATINLHNLDIVARRLRLAVPNLELSDAQFEEELQRMIQMVRRTRELQRKFQQDMKTMSF